MLSVKIVPRKSSTKTLATQAWSSKTSTSTYTRARITDTFIKLRKLAPWVLGALLSVQNMHWRLIKVPCLSYNEFLQISQQQ